MVGCTRCVDRYALVQLVIVPKTYIGTLGPGGLFVDLRNRYRYKKSVLLSIIAD